MISNPELRSAEAGSEIAAPALSPTWISRIRDRRGPKSARVIAASNG
jgi:hypothetical protein